MPGSAQPPNLFGMSDQPPQGPYGQQPYGNQPYGQQQPQYGQPQYGQQPYGQAPPPPPYNSGQFFDGNNQQQKPGKGLAIGALICAIIGILTSWTVIGGIVLGIVALILGLIALSKAKKGQASGSGMSIAAIILGIVSVALSIALIVWGVGLFKDAGGDDFIDCMNNAGSDSSAQQQCSDDLRGNIENKFDVSIPEEAPNFTSGS